jgi:hypothetical protein
MDVTLILPYGGGSEQQQVLLHFAMMELEKMQLECVALAAKC